MKIYIQYLLFITLIVYSIIYIYDELAIKGGGTGIYVFFNFPLALVLMYVSVRFLKKDIIWVTLVAIIGLITAALVLIPPPIYYLFF